MKLEQSFEVDAPLERVWQALVDVERVAPCLPGAAVTGRNEDGSYNGTFTIKIGPTTASYAGKLEMQDIDEASHSATMHAQGSDRRGQGGATATISSRVTTADGSTHVEVVTEYHITGRLARFGRGGMIEDISERLLREFAGRLQSSLSTDAGAVAAGVHEPVPPPTEAVPPPTEAAPPPPASVEPGAAGREEHPTQPFERLETGPTRPSEPPVAAAPAGAEAATDAPPPPPPPPEVPPPPAREAPLPPQPPHAPPPPPTPQSETKPAPPMQGLSLVGSVVLNRVRRNAVPVIAVAGGLIVLGMMRRRRH